MTARPEVRIFPDLDSLSRAAADLILDLSRSVVAPRNRFSIALSGGSTPRTLYALFASSPWKESLPWQGMHFFWADERCVPPDRAESNYNLANEAFLSRVPVPRANIHRIRGEEGPDRAARLYEDECRSFFGESDRFDLVLLGAGEDGHTASLFPGSAALKEQKRRAVPVPAEGSRLARVTLSLPVLNAAGRIMFLVSGTNKAAVVQEVVEEENRKEYPAGLVHPAQGTIFWLIDRDAASRLRSLESPRRSA